MKSVLYGILAALLVTAALAGTNNLPIEVPGVIQLSHVNKFQTALSGDLVPRNSLGNVGAAAASVGTSLYRWGNFYGQRLTLQNGATEYPVVFSVPAGSTVATPIQWLTNLPSDPQSFITPPPNGPRGRYTTNLNIDSQGFIGLGGQTDSQNLYGGSPSGSGVFTGTSTTFTQVTNSGFSKYISGKQNELILLQPIAQSFAWFDQSAGGAAEMILGFTANPTAFSCGSATTLAYYQFPASTRYPLAISYLLVGESLYPGKYNFGVCVRVTGGTFTVQNMQVFMQEL